MTRVRRAAPSETLSATVPADDGNAAGSSWRTQASHGPSHNKLPSPMIKNIAGQPCVATRYPASGRPTAGPIFVPVMYTPTANPRSFSTKCARMYRSEADVTTLSPNPTTRRVAISPHSPVISTVAAEAMLHKTIPIV